jgi:hypothetical protein
VNEIKFGTQDRSVLVFLADPAQTDGSGKTGLNAAALKCSYTRVETDNDVVITDVTGSLNDLSALTDAHNDWGLKEVSSTIAPGLYRLDIADAVFASGAWEAVVYLSISASDAAPAPLKFTLVAYDPLDGAALGLSRLDDTISSRASQASVDTIDSIVDAIVQDTGVDIPLLLTTLDGIVDTILVDTSTDLPASLAAISSALVTIAGYIDTEVAAIKAKTDTLPASPAATGDAMTLTSGERTSVATALLDLADGVETSETVRQCLRLLRAALVGKSDSFPVGPVHFRDRADSKNRITATVDADGNRTAVTTDAT